MDEQQRCRLINYPLLLRRMLDDGRSTGPASPGLRCRRLPRYHKADHRPPTPPTFESGPRSTHKEGGGDVPYILRRLGVREIKVRILRNSTTTPPSHPFYSASVQHTKTHRLYRGITSLSSSSLLSCVVRSSSLASVSCAESALNIDAQRGWRCDGESGKGRGEIGWEFPQNFHLLGCWPASVYPRMMVFSRNNGSGREGDFNLI